MILRALLILQLTALVCAADAVALPVAVPASDPHLHYSGRWDTRDVAGPRCGWSSCSVWIAFSGTSLNVVLGGQPGNMIQVAVDGKPTAVLTIVAEQSVYAVVSDAPAGQHTVELSKRTPSQAGIIQVKGFQLNQEASLKDMPALTRRVEFIGDSITAGYGNEAASKEEPYTLGTQNAWLSFAAIAARQLNAELMNTSHGGIWLLDHDNKDTMPRMWNRVLPYDPKELWDFSSWQADAVVVNLGTNDSSNNQPIPEKPWSDTYLAFIACIRSAYPQAHIFLTIGPMGHGRRNRIPILNAAIAAACKDAGDPKVHALAFPIHSPDDGNGMGAAWHPSVKTHQAMADLICAAISKELGW